ncbi:hypothetical protein [Sporomusa acidovorans]|uniref:Uncharacterized protein n=1 Tax=Sporomusa acidovorans (strain ATCC 49682 / DSM 3132 / Mol) TaxID=1123286 RepID=A0ABZ3JAN5_SPOA4|nr:hypothetical protein [Sporomusa acidovorans]OZC22964.1 hypothetical protein SPACI_10370 [Sporomusa acidovorans DSM 3132]SDE93863.1 hypothetical protein SAMN04488499_102716 [Sporomusa acidovorans]
MDKQIILVIKLGRNDVLEALRLQGIEPTEQKIQAALYSQELAEGLSRAVLPYCQQALDVLITEYLEDD